MRHFVICFLKDSTLLLKQDWRQLRRGDGSIEMMNLTMQDFTNSLYESRVRRAKWKTSLAEVNSQVKIFAKLAEKHFKCIERACQLEDWDKALEHINHCLRLCPKRGAFFVQRAEIYMKLNDFTAAIADYEHVISMSRSNLNHESPDSREDTTREYLSRLIQVHILYGRHLMQHDAISGALEQFHKSKQLINRYCDSNEEFIGSVKSVWPTSELTECNSPGETLVLKDMLDCLDASGQRQKYLTLLNKAIRQSRPSLSERASNILGDTHPDSPKITILSLIELYVARARVFLQEGLGSLQRAQADAQTILQLAPEHPAALKLFDYMDQLSSGEKDRAMTLTAKGRLPEALHHLHRAIAARPDIGILRLERGAVHRRLGNLQDALSDVLQGLNMLSGKTDQYIYHQGLDQMLMVMQDIVDELFKKGCYEDCSQIARYLLDIRHNDSKLRIRLGDCYRMTERYEEAVNEYIRTKEEVQSNSSLVDVLDSRMCQSWFLLSMEKVKNKESEKALQLIDKCVHLYPSVVEFYVVKAHILARLGNAEMAWENILLVLYLLLSDRMLNRRTGGKWDQLDYREKLQLCQLLVSRSETLIGPLITMFVPKPLRLKQLADSDTCTQVASSLERVIYEQRLKGARKQYASEECKQPVDISEKSMFSLPLPELKLLSTPRNRSHENKTKSIALIARKKELKGELNEIRTHWSRSTIGSSVK